MDVSRRWQIKEGLRSCDRCLQADEMSKRSDWEGCGSAKKRTGCKRKEGKTLGNGSAVRMHMYVCTIGRGLCPRSVRSASDQTMERHDLRSEPASEKERGDAPVMQVNAGKGVSGGSHQKCHIHAMHVCM